jgi:lipid-binding SYLF domain-containing protein
MHFGIHCSGTDPIADGQVIPRSVLENAKGFCILSVFKAGFLFSARGGSGIVIAKLENGCGYTLIFMSKSSIWRSRRFTAWSAPSAIGTAGLGLGGQIGAEITDFLIVLNSRSVCARPANNNFWTHINIL